ncbi:MAG TPA: flagellar type III secretion system protein FlhB [Sphingorhabdus sp.]|jgi:flagellar biosynthetic protein FlhB|uniref:flagellar type III secretion system protein FlhB n=1 Tax=Sphingorhabdus sp. TaxID=1902408 RepID=UPI002BF4563A|nr:flagellar type III secretion system protein FlhB [Sphingorhabdus sp.]HMT41430.1 flagellar type III secretion system protein FlhB [Sphingorhabdus sp.]HMU22620.1 flagellar type III secretion system protein FlhB [Sphingorhabdus sp.]
MAEAPDRDHQTEAPTPKRRKDAAEEGDVLVSRELASALVMLAGIGWLALAGQWLVNAAVTMLRNGLAIERSHFTAFDISTRLTNLLTPLILPFAALLLASLAAAIAGPALLGSLGWRSKAMVFKANRLSPLSGIRRIFGMQGLIELAKALAKAGLLGGVGWWLAMGELSKLLSLSAADPLTASTSVGSSLISLLLALGLAMLLIALLDVPAQYFQRTRRLRMSREQVKEEMRQSEGAPELKAQLRARQQAILSQSARKAMTEANVVLNNPSHFSVALRYRPGADAAPVVVARGRDDVALAMRELACEREVPMLDYPVLTRALYFTTRAGQAIPEDLYQAVAIILAFVFRLDRELGEQKQPPVVDVPHSKRFDTSGKPEAN